LLADPTIALNSFKRQRAMGYLDGIVDTTVNVHLVPGAQSGTTRAELHAGGGIIASKRRHPQRQCNSFRCGCSSQNVSMRREQIMSRPSFSKLLSNYPKKTKPDVLFADIGWSDLVNNPAYHNTRVRPKLLFFREDGLVLAASLTAG
jgi:hypothetical protein